MMNGSPFKRLRENTGPPFDSFEIVAKVHQALTTKQRLHVFSEIRGYLAGTSKHDVKANACLPLIEAGLIPALFLQLSYVSHRHGATLQEHEQICDLIDILLWQTDDTQRHAISAGLGEEFFELLCAHDGLPSSALSVLHWLSGTPDGAAKILKCRRLMFRFVEVLQKTPTNMCNALEIFGVMKNVTYYGEDYRRVVLDYQRLVISLIWVAQQSCFEKGLERLSSILRNLSLSTDCRSVMVKEPVIVRALVELVGDGSTPVMLKNALNTITNLALNNESSLILIFHGDGVLLHRVKRIAIEERDPVIRKRAVRLLRLLVNESSAPIMVHNQELIKILTDSALKDESQDVRREAGEAFAKFASLVNADQPLHQSVLDALTTIALSPSMPADVVASALKDHAFQSTNRTTMGERRQMIDALAKIGLSERSSSMAKEDACCALMYLCTVEANRQKLCSSQVLDALIANASGELGSSVSCRRHCIEALIQLASVESNRKQMAKDRSFLPVLIKFATSAPDSTTKFDVKELILVLVAEL